MVVALLLVFLDLYVAPKTPGHKKDLVLTLAQILAGTALLSSLYFTGRTLQVNREGQITERFTRAIDQLGKTDVEGNKLFESRLGGIYALERIAEEAADDYHWPIRQIFTAYLRTHAPWQGSRIIEPEEDIQTILRIIGGRASHGEPERLLLSSTDFSRYNLSDAHLENAVLVSTRLESAHLSGAHLQGADLSGARLQGANLTKADLRSALLRGTHLEGAYLIGADLRGADLADAYLARTDVQVADLRGVQNFDTQSLDQANGHWNTENKEDNTKVGEVPRPAWWSNLPKDGGLLVPGDYSIKVCETPLHFHVGEGWHSLLFLPHGFSLSLTGSVAHTGFPSRTSSANISGPLLSFRSEKYVCHPQKPKEPGVLQRAPMDMEGMVDWYTKHPYLDTTEPDNCEIGGAPGKQFNAEIKAGKEHELLVNAPHFDRAALPLFPGAPRDAPFVLFPQIRNRIIVLELKHETMVIILESSPAEFGRFCERVADVLATISWDVMPSR